MASWAAYTVSISISQTSSSSLPPTSSLPMGSNTKLSPTYREPAWHTPATKHSFSMARARSSVFLPAETLIDINIRNNRAMHFHPSDGPSDAGTSGAARTWPACTHCPMFPAPAVVETSAETYSHPTRTLPPMFAAGKGVQTSAPTYNVRKCTHPSRFAARKRPQTSAPAHMPSRRAHLRRFRRAHRPSGVRARRRNSAMASHVQDHTHSYYP